jgi:DNA-binding response OmpR family regulator
MLRRKGEGGSRSTYILIRHSTAKILTTFGYKVEVTHDGEEGVRLFNEDGRFDCVITGIRIPGMDGNEVARYIRRSDRADTPVVAMTGAGEDAIDGELFNFAFIKPFRIKSLVEVMRSLS